jgi:hypothetical protein
MTTWWATPISQQETCWIISTRLTATSLRSTSRSTLNTCAGLGILNSQLSPCSSKFKIVPTFLKQGGVLIGHPQQINFGYAKIFATGHFMSACRRWNEKNAIEKTWTQFKSHFAAAHRQHKQMQRESAVTAGYHSANAAVTHNEDQMAEATIGALANLSTATAADRGVVAALAQANSHLAKQLEDNSNELRELKALLKKESIEKRGQRSSNPLPSNYFWTHGYKVGSTHTSLTCKLPKPGHKTEATRAYNMGGSQANRECLKYVEPHPFLNNMSHQVWTLDAPATLS